MEIKVDILDKIKYVFYRLVDDAQNGFTMNISGDEFSYIRFNYIEEGKLYAFDGDFLGNDAAVDESYDAEYSNGTFNYLPTLVVDNREEFFNSLGNFIQEYLDFYGFERAITEFGEDNIIKCIIMTFFSNARYIDYEHPIEYINRYIDFFHNKVSDCFINNISLLDGSNIITNTKKDTFGYETPYYFETVVTNGDDRCYLPNISYGISGNTCYIYAIQNKNKNEDNVFNKKIKRALNKVNGNVFNDTDYDIKDTILGVPSSFVVSLSVFLKSLKSSGINNVEVITFLPDRYFEKKATLEYDGDLIQENLTQRLVLLFYRIGHHINGIQVNYPIYDGIDDSKFTGDNLLIRLCDNFNCSNNLLLGEILSKMDLNKKVR